jgi:bacterioferritin-associated ferredoxin
MMVCLCNGVSERKVRKAIERGAATEDEVAAACGAGDRCGGCRPTVGDMLVRAQPVRLAIA